MSEPPLRVPEPHGGGAQTGAEDEEGELCVHWKVCWERHSGRVPLGRVISAEVGAGGEGWRREKLSGEAPPGSL